MSFASSLADVAEYARTRLCQVRFLPLALFLSLAASMRSVNLDLTQWGLDALVTLPWIFQFRLMDDLADRERDRVDHPDRLLPRVRVSPFVALVAMMALGNILLALGARGPRAGLVFLGLSAAFSARRLVPKRVRPPMLPASLVVLLKYPAFVYFLSGSVELELLLVYASFVVYELLHDQRCWAEPLNRSCLSLAMAAMVVAATLLVPVPDWEELGAVKSGGIAGGCAVLIWLCGRRLLHYHPGAWPYSVFLVSSFWMLQALPLHR